MSETKYRGRRAVSIDNRYVRVTVLREGGHVAEIHDKAAGVNPLWMPPWSTIEPSEYGPAHGDVYGHGSDARLLAGIMGHNLCLDIFGPPSEEEARNGLTAHGEGSVAAYDLDAAGQSIVARTHLPMAGLEFHRRIELRDNVVAFSETLANVSGADRAIGWTQHVTLGPPFLERGVTEFRASAGRSKVFESAFGADDYLREGAEFDWPLAPARDGRVADLRTFNRMPRSSAYTTHLIRNLSKRYNINQADFGTTPINSRLPFPQFQPAMLYSAAIGTANFQGLSLRLEKRYSAGLFFLANYQLSENRDNGSGEVEANDTAFRADPDADESLSRYHQRHRSAFSFGYELPFGEGRRWLNSAGPIAYALGGWQVQGVIRVGSGFPFTLSGTNVCQCGSFVPQRVNYAPGREGDRGVVDNPTQTQWYDRTAYVLPASGFQGTVGRNTLIGPGSKQVDFSVSKRFPLGASRLEFRGEIFNLFNTTNFGQPDGNINNVTAGVISSADDARNMQFGIRLAW